MMTDVEMIDDEVRQQVERADCFIEQLRDAITATVVDPASARADNGARGRRSTPCCTIIPSNGMQRTAHQRAAEKRTCRGAVSCQ
jgi:hypothetical protein